MNVTLKPAQWEVFLNDRRFRMLVAGRRFGKTYLALVELCRAAWGPGRTAWYVAPTYRQAKRIAWTELKRLTKDYWLSKPNETDLTIELSCGGTVSLRGADNYDSLRGHGLNFVVLDEYASMAPAAWTEVLRPMLADRAGNALFIGTPQGYNHFYDLYTAVQVHSDWATFQYTTAEGGNVSSDELAQAASLMDKRVYQQEFCASFETLTSGRAYYAFDRRFDVGSVPYDPCSPLVWALDFNVDPGCSLIAQVKSTQPHPILSSIQVENRVHVLDEIVLRDSNTYEVCKEFDRRTESWLRYLPPGQARLKVEVYGDAAGETRNASAPRTSWQIIKDFFTENRSSYEVTFRYATQNPLVRDRVACVNAMLCDARDRRSLTISPQCQQLIRDLEQVTWKKDANGNDTGDLDKSNSMRTHTSDALGYFVAQRFPMRPIWPTNRPLI